MADACGSAFGDVLGANGNGLRRQLDRGVSVPFFFYSRVSVDALQADGPELRASAKRPGLGCCFERRPWEWRLLEEVTDDCGAGACPCAWTRTGLVLVFPDVGQARGLRPNETGVVGEAYPGWSTWHGGLVIGKHWATPWPGTMFSVSLPVFWGCMWRIPNRVRRLAIGTRRPGRNTRHQVRSREAAAADRDWTGTGYPGWSTWHGGLVIGKHWATPWPRTMFSVSLSVFLGVYVAHPQPRAAVANRDSV